MLFPVPENTRCLKTKNLQKQNFPVTTYCSISKAGKHFLKGGIGRVRRGSDFSSAFFGKENPDIPPGPEDGESSSGILHQ